MNRASDSFRRWCTLNHIDATKIESLEPNKIEEFLPGIFATDFFEYLGKTPKVYIFINSYEAPWESKKSKGNFHEKDKWIRNKVIPNMPGLSWVICGREKLPEDFEYDPVWEMSLEQHQVDKLSKKYSDKFLEGCGIENKDIRDIIIKASDGVLYYLNLSVDTYEMIKTCKKRQPIPEDFGKTQHEIFKKFVNCLDADEIRVLKVLSVPNFWDLDLFKMLIWAEFDTRYSAANTEYPVTNTGYPETAFSELTKFSFIKKDAGERYLIHALMRKNLQESQNADDRKPIHQFLLEHYSKKLKDLKIEAISQKHEVALIEAFYHAKEVFEAEDLFNWFISVSEPFYRATFWQLIIPPYEEILIILKEKLGQEHPSVATTLNNLAELYESKGDYEKALTLYMQSLEIRENVLGPQHQSVAATLKNLAELYENMGDYVATTLNNLAEFYKNMGDDEKTILFYKRSLQISESVLGPKHPSIVPTLNNLAGLYRNIEDYETALPLYIQSFEISENVLGPEHPSVATILNNLAELYKIMGDYEKALLLYKRTLEIRETTFGPQHPYVATTLNNLALLYESLGYYEEALSLYMRDLKISENVLGPQHPSVAVTLNNLAALYYNMGNYEKALPLYKRSLKIRKTALGPKHPYVATTLNNLAGLYSITGEYDKALPLYNQSLETSESVLGPQHPFVATILNNLAELYRNVGEYDKALPLYMRSLKISENVLGPQHPSVATILNNLAALKKCRKEISPDKLVRLKPENHG